MIMQNSITLNIGPAYQQMGIVGTVELRLQFHGNGSATLSTHESDEMPGLWKFHHGVPTLHDILARHGYLLVSAVTQSGEKYYAYQRQINLSDLQQRLADHHALIAEFL